jgi:hypothetical protein
MVVIGYEFHLIIRQPGLDDQVNVRSIHFVGSEISDVLCIFMLATMVSQSYPTI